MLEINKQKYYSQSEVRRILMYIINQNFISMMYSQTKRVTSCSSITINNQYFFNNLDILQYIKNNSYKINEDKVLRNHYKNIDDGILQLIENARQYNNFKFNKVY